MQVQELLDTPIEWIPTGDRAQPYVSTIGDQDWTIQVNPTAEQQPAYALLKDGETICELDRWPEQWKRPRIASSLAEQVRQDAPVWLDSRRDEIRRTLGAPDWGGGDLDAWLPLGVSVWFDGDETARRISLSVSLASNTRPFPRYRKSLVGVRIGAPMAAVLRATGGQLPAAGVSGDSRFYDLPFDDFTLRFGIWNRDVELGGETFPQNTVRNIVVDRHRPGPDYSRCQPADVVLACIDCFGIIENERADTCPHCGLRLELCELSPEKYAGMPRRKCRVCQMEMFEAADICPLCRTRYV